MMESYCLRIGCLFGEILGLLIDAVTRQRDSRSASVDRAVGLQMRSVTRHYSLRPGAPRLSSGNPGRLRKARGRNAGISGKLLEGRQSISGA